MLLAVVALVHVLVACIGAATAVVVCRLLFPGGL